MTLAELLVEVRKRRGTLPGPASLPHAMATLMGLAIFPTEKATVLRKVLMGLAQPTWEPKFSSEELAEIEPVALCSLDYLIEAILEGRCSTEELQEAFGAPGRPIQ